MFDHIPSAIIKAAWIISLPFWVLNAGLGFAAWHVWNKWKDRF